MTKCSEQIGVFGCAYEATALEPHPGLCYLHGKRAAGLFRCGAKVSANSWSSCWLAEGHRGGCSALPAPRRGVTDDAMFSDEAREIVRVLRTRTQP